MACFQLLSFQDISLSRNFLASCQPIVRQQRPRTAAAREPYTAWRYSERRAVSSSLLAGYVPSSLRGIERCAREFRRVFSTSCIVYLAPFTRLLAGIDYLAITVFRIVRGHSCLSVVPFSPFLSPVMAPAPRLPPLSSPFFPILPPLLPARPLILFLAVLARSSAPLRPTRSLQEFFAQQRAYR